MDDIQVMLKKRIVSNKNSLSVKVVKDITCTSGYTGDYKCDV